VAREVGTDKPETVSEKPDSPKPEGAVPEAKGEAQQKPGPAQSRRPGHQGGQGHHGNRGQRGRGGNNVPAREEDGITEKVLFINRCAKVVKGGRRFSFSALVVVGDGEGKVGIGFGKANEVSECIRKANEAGRKSMEPINLEQTTIPHEVIGEFGGSRVLMRPAAPGTGLIAGGGVRAVAEAAGVKDLLAKSLGSSNPSNVAKAALEGLKQLTHREEILQARGK